MIRFKGYATIITVLLILPNPSWLAILGLMSAQLKMKTSWLKASSKNEEAILLLRFGMPLANRQFWYNTEELQCMLRQGGLPKLPNRFVSRALKSLKNKPGIEMNSFQKKNWYCFDFNRDKVPYGTPKEQLRSLKGLIAGQKGFIIPALPPNHFSLFELNYLKEYTAIMNEPNFEISTFPSDATTESPNKEVAPQPSQSTPIWI